MNRRQVANKSNRNKKVGDSSSKTTRQTQKSPALYGNPKRD
ncbi:MULTISPECIES: hypothetical protein [Kluyvera]|nr:MULTISPECIES: hypothetical protein [Kluyvera]